MDKRLIRVEDLKKDKIRVTFGNQSSGEYPLANVRIIFENEEYCVEAAVAENLAEDVLLGQDVPLHKHMVKRLSKEEQLELLHQLKKDNEDQAEENVEGEILMAKTRAMRKKEQRTTSSERERSTTSEKQRTTSSERKRSTTSEEQQRTTSSGKKRSTTSEEQQRTISSQRKRSIVLQRSSRGLLHLRGKGVLLQRSSRGVLFQRSSRGLLHLKGRVLLQRSSRGLLHLRGRGVLLQKSSRGLLHLRGRGVLLQRSYFIWEERECYFRGESMDSRRRISIYERTIF